MCYALRMTVLQSRKNLEINSSAFVLLQFPTRLLFNVRMKTPIPYVLHDQKHLFACLYDIIQLCNIWVLHSLHQFNFSFYRFSSLWFKQFYFFINLNCYFFFGFVVHSNSHYCICSRSNNFTNCEIFERTLLAKSLVINLFNFNFIDYYLFFSLLSLHF